MKRLLFIILLSGIFCSTAAQELTYEQLSQLKSRKEFKGKQITSYIALDGQTYSIGDKIILGHKSGLFTKTIKFKSGVPMIYNTLHDKSVFIKKFTLKGSAKKGFRVKTPVRSKSYIAIVNYGMYISDLDKAIAIGEVISKSFSNSNQIADTASTPQPSKQISLITTEQGELAFSQVAESEGGEFQAYIASNGEKLVVGETEVIIGSSFDNKFKYVKVNPQLEGATAQIQSIYLKPKAKNKSVTMLLTLGSSRVEVTSIEEALANGEIFIKKK